MELKNIDDLLRECPEGTKLYSPIFGVVSLENVNTDGWIKVIPKRTGILQLFYPDGRFSEDGEVMLFPSDTNRNWDNFVIPFKDGDILATELGSVFILKTDINSDERYGCYVGVDWEINYLWLNNFFAYKHVCRYANEDEKQKLFKKIKENGYKWDNVTKVLCKIVEPKFKVGDTINNGKTSITIDYIDNEYYYEIKRNIANKLSIKNQDEWNLISEKFPNKFDITTLKPFDRVLVRLANNCIWTPKLFSHYNSNSTFYPFIITDEIGYPQCIPYENNEHLLGTTDDCDNFYKTWE
jgi:hypothetical protein